MEENLQKINKDVQVSNHLKLFENYFFGMPSQGNVYTLILIRNTSGSFKILVASLKGEIFYIEYINGKYVTTENPLANIPKNAEIVSMNACTEDKKLNICVAMTESHNPCEKGILHYYSDWDFERSDFAEEGGFVSLDLSYIPYHLYFTHIPDNSGWQTVWLLSGSDRSIHMFHPMRQLTQVDKSLTTAWFPEFETVRGITLHMDISYSEDRKRRFTVTSGESGNVQIFQVNVSSPSDPRITYSKEIIFDYPCSAVRIFHRRHKTSHSLGEKLGLLKAEETKEVFECLDEPLALITTTLESCFVRSLSSPDDVGRQLVDSGNYDVVTCCLVADVDFDGTNEILLGTYGQVVLIYKEKNETWELIQSLSLPSPVLGLRLEDVLADGVKELIISTMMGLHVYQFDPAYVSSILLKRLKKLRDSR